MLIPYFLITLKFTLKRRRKLKLGETVVTVIITQVKSSDYDCGETLSRGNASLVFCLL